RWDSLAAKQRAWDSEYEVGRWTYDRGGQNNEGQEAIYRFIDRYNAGGSILDLGCGSGMTALEMKCDFREYVGVDVSQVAVEKARATLSREADRANKVRFFVSDISTFLPTGQFSVILFRESIYYVPQRRIKGMLERYCSYLGPDGVFIVRLCDRYRYKSIVTILETELKITETYMPGDSTMAIFVCSPGESRKIL
ncbi:MAG: class I SAM-dependent methyltransferase, partial [Candidatus Micrarchaeaceae archaeon]